MKTVLKVLLAILVVIAIFLGIAYLNRAAVISAVIDWDGLSEPFLGVTHDGTVREGLFPIRRTGADTDGIRHAVERFLGSLDESARSETVFPIDSDEWRRWNNIHLYVRQGTGLLEMNADQKDAAFRILESAMSPRGYAQARDIMRLDTTLGELNDNNFAEYGEERYWFTVMGEPHASEPWGWQVDGHHLVINQFVLGDQVVMSPVFLGSEPVIARAGKHKGVAVLQEEQDRGLEFMQSLSEDEQSQAVISTEKPGNNNYGEFHSDNAVVPQEGLNVGALTGAKLEGFLALVGLYVGNLKDDHASVKMTEIIQHLDDTYFTWVGPVSDQTAYYYRIMSPVIMIEFDHQSPANLRHLAENNSPQRDHIHVVIRTPNGNDYGKDLLRQHIERSHGPSPEDEEMAARITAQQGQSDRHRFDLPRDAGRMPYETFQFLGLRAGMTALDVGAYAGYTTEMMAAAVGPEGKVYSHNTKRVLERFAEGYYQRTMDERLAGDRLPNVSLLVNDYEDLGLTDEVDVAWLGNLLHDFYYRDGEDKAIEFLAAIAKTLKPGGVLGLTDHVGVASGDNKSLHRLEPRIARRLLSAAGFDVVAESGLFANPEDDYSLMVYDERVYLNTDRFFFKAVKR